MPPPWLECASYWAPLPHRRAQSTGCTTPTTMDCAVSTCASKSPPPPATPKPTRGAQVWLGCCALATRLPHRVITPLPGNFLWLVAGKASALRALEPLQLPYMRPKAVGCCTQLLVAPPVPSGSQGVWVLLSHAMSRSCPRALQLVLAA